MRTTGWAGLAVATCIAGTIAAFSSACSSGGWRGAYGLLFSALVRKLSGKPPDSVEIDRIRSLRALLPLDLELARMIVLGEFGQVERLATLPVDSVIPRSGREYRAKQAFYRGLAALAQGDEPRAHALFHTVSRASESYLDEVRWARAGRR